jgi:hypothetical protein
MDSKLIEIYVKKYIKNELNFYGIKLIPEIVVVDGNTKIKWSLENPNNISYNQYVISDFVIDSQTDFFKLVGITGYNEIRKINIFTDIEIKYISSDLKNKINQTLKSKRYVEFRGLGIYYKAFDLGFRFFSDSTEFEFSVMIHEVFNLKDGSVFDKEKFEELISDYYEEGEYGDMSDAYIDDVLDLIWNIPTLTNKEVTYFMSYADVFDKNGNRLVF